MGEGEVRGRIVGLLREFAEQLMAGGLRVNSVVLTGSYARGDWLRDSDLDVIIVSDDFKNLKFYEREELVTREWRHPLPLEPWCYTREEVLKAVRGRPRIDIVDAVEQGIVVYDDCFWEGVRAEYARNPCRRSRHGLIMLRGERKEEPATDIAEARLVTARRTGKPGRGRLPPATGG